MDIRNDNFSDAFAIELFYMEEAYNQNKILNYINERICYANDNIRGLIAVNESVLDSIKKFFQRIIDFIKKAFGQFKERFSELLLTDKKFFEKYKDVIEKNPFKKHTLSDWYEYDIDKLNEIKVPEFKFEDIEKHMSEDKDYDESTFIADNLNDVHAAIKTRVKEDNDFDSVKELVEASIRGTETKDEIDMSILDKGKIIKYCKNIDATQKVLEQDQNMLNTNSSKIQTIVAKKLNEIRNNNANKDTTTTSSSDTNNQQQGEQQAEQEESAVIDPLSFPLFEGKIGKVEDSPKSSSSSSSSNGGTAHSSVNKNVNKANTQDTQNKVDALGNTVDASGNSTGKDVSDKEADRIEEATKQFFSSCSVILSTKLTLALAIYKDYMKILRVHVRDYVGGENGKDNLSGTNSNDPKASLTIAGASIYKDKIHKNNSTTANINVTVKYKGEDAIKIFENKVSKLNANDLENISDDKFYGKGAIKTYYGTDEGAGKDYRGTDPIVVVYNGGPKGFSAAIHLNADGSIATARIYKKIGENPF